MIDHYWSVICARAVIDRDSNNLTLQDVIEQINILAPEITPTVPINIPMNLDVVCFWGRTDLTIPSKGDVLIKLFSPSGDPISEKTVSVDLQAHKRMRTILRVAGLSIKSDGVYNFRVYLKTEIDTNWKEVSKVPLEIIKAPLSIQSN